MQLLLTAFCASILAFNTPIFARSVARESGSFSSQPTVTPSRPERRIYALLTLNALQEAVLEAEEILRTRPRTKEIEEAYIMALSKAGDYKKAAAAWENYLTLDPDETQKNALIKEMAWGVIENGAYSSQPLVRLYASLGAFLGQDARGVALLRKGMDDTNAHIRAVAVLLASNLRDAALQEKVLQLFQSEKNSFVKLEVIKALGKMKIAASQASLIALIADERALAEEKVAAMESLIHLMENTGREEMQRLAASNRAGLRQLACEVIFHHGGEEHVDLLIPLLKDASPDVRCAAVQALGRLRVKSVGNVSLVNIFQQMTEDSDPQTAIIAAWALTLAEPARGMQAFGRWSSHPNRDVRLLASAALAETGSYGSPLMQTQFCEAEDAYVRMNLAFGLLAQRVRCDEACACLVEGLSKISEKMMWQEKGPFRYVAPSKVKHSEVIPNCPEAANQLVRLEICNTLAILEDPHAQLAIRNFLKEKHWGITGIAAALMLTEGDENAMQIVEPLLEDGEKNIKMQAAIVLALWGRGEKATSVLEGMYPVCDREDKEKILECLGHVGSRTSLPFLLAKLKEPCENLRILAASSLILCLYH